mgnify:CR=1 FL=1
MAKSPAWTRKEGKDPKGGLNAKGRASAKAQGMNLKPPAPNPKTKEEVTFIDFARSERHLEGVC